MGRPVLVIAALYAITLVPLALSQCPAPIGRPVICKGFGKVQREIEKLFDADQKKASPRNLAALAIRTGFHCSATWNAKEGKNGSNGGTCRMKEELDNAGNVGIPEMLNALEPIFATAKTLGQPISHADLYTLAASTAVQYLGGPFVPWQSGRVDSSNPRDAAPDGTLPMPNLGPNSKSDPGFDRKQKATADGYKAQFARMGLNAQETTALCIGGHSIGSMHTFVSGFTGTWVSNPFKFSNQVATNLMRKKWHAINPNNGPMQYAVVNATRGPLFLPSDNSQKFDPDFRPHAAKYANDCGALYNDFAAAFAKLMASGAP